MLARLFLLIMGLTLGFAQGGFQDLDNILKTVQIEVKATYRIFHQPISVNIQIPLFKYVYQLRYLRQSLSLVSNQHSLTQVPANIELILRKQLLAQGFEIDSQMNEIDKMLIKSWKYQFEMGATLNHFTATLNEKFVPQLFLRYDKQKMPKIRFPEHLIEVIQILETKYIMSLYTSIATNEFHSFSWQVRNKIVNILENRYNGLEKTCKATEAHLGPTLNVFSPSIEKKDHILWSLIATFNLKVDKEQSMCLIAYIAYMQLLENDLGVVLSYKLGTKPRPFSFVIDAITYPYLLIPSNKVIPPGELSKKLIPEYLPRINRRGFVLDLLGAASDEARLKNSMNIQSLYATSKDLKRAQVTLSDNFEHLMGSRKANFEILSNIRQRLEDVNNHLKFSEFEINNITHNTQVLINQSVGFMKASISLELISKEVGLIKQGIESEKRLVNSAMDQGQVVIDRSSLLMTHTPIKPPQIKMTLEGIQINTILFSEPEYLTKYDIKTIPFSLGTQTSRIKLPRTLIANHRYKVFKADLNQCDPCTKVCAGHTVLQDLHECERYLIANTNATLHTVAQCLTLVEPDSPPKMEFIHVQKGILVFTKNQVSAQRMCPETSNRVNIVPGTTLVPIPKGCTLKIGNKFITGRPYDIQEKTFDYAFFASNLNQSLFTLLANETNMAHLGNHRFKEATSGLNLNKSLQAYYKTLHTGWSALPFDSAGWDALHPMELAGHLSSATIIFILLAILIGFFVVLCCCKARIRGIFTPVPAPIERDYLPLSPVDRDPRLPQYSTLPPGAVTLPETTRRRLEPEYHRPPNSEESQPEADRSPANILLQSPVRPSEEPLTSSSIGFTNTHDAQLVNTVVPE